MSAAAVEQSIQLQVQDIAAVKQAFAESLGQRQPDTLWWLVDYSQNIVYEDRVKGSTIHAVDGRVMSADVGSFYSDWFTLQNAYFSQDQPFQGVQSLQDAISKVYRWRVPQYFNDVSTSGVGQAFSPQYVFPYQDMNLGVFAVGGSPTFTKGDGPVDSTVCGPGILRIAPLTAIASATTLTLTVVYPDGSTGSMTVVVSSGALTTALIPVGGQALTAAYTASTGNGIVSVGATTGFKVAPAGGTQNLVVITEDITAGGLLPLWATEVAELVAVGSGTLTLRQPTPFGATAPFANGLRNNYSTAAKIYPLFNDVTAVSQTGGTTGNQMMVSFFADWTQGFVNVSGVVVPQVMGGLSKGVVEEESASDTSSGGSTSPTTKTDSGPSQSGKSATSASKSSGSQTGFEVRH